MALDASLMPHMHAEVVTTKGPISVAYQRNVGAAGQSIEMTVEVPVNSRATVHFEPLLASGRCTLLTEGEAVLFSEAGKEAKGSVYSKDGMVASGVEAVTEDQDTGVVSVQVGAGKYQFQRPLAVRKEERRCTC